MNKIILQPKEEKMKINDLVWLKQHDYNGECWTLGRVKGFTKKMIKCEDLHRQEVTQEKNKVGNFKPHNVRKLTIQELKNDYYKELIIC